MSDTWARVIAALVFLLTFFWLRDGGVLLTPQGLSYVVAARSLVEGHGLEIAPGTPLSHFGPLYALLLAGGALAGLDVIPSVYLVNCSVFAACLLAVHALGRALDLPAGTLLASFALWAAHATLLRAARPDLLVIGATLFALLAALRYRETRSTPALVATATACALAALGRYMAALTLIPLVGAAVWLFARPSGGATRLRHTGLFTALAAGPLALWIGRNVALTGYLTGMSRTGERAPAEGTTLLGNLAGLVRTFGLDVFGVGAMGVRPLVYDGAPLPHPVATAAVVLAVAALVAFAWVARRGEVTRWLRRLVAPRRSEEVGLSLVAVAGGWYVVALVVLWTVGNNDPINTRYLAPAYPSLLVLLLALYTGVGRSGDGRWPRRALALAALLVMLVNTGKSLALLAGEPDETLLEVRSRHKKIDRWVEDLPWRP